MYVEYLITFVTLHEGPSSMIVDRTLYLLLSMFMLGNTAGNVLLQRLQMLNYCSYIYNAVFYRLNSQIKAE